MAKQRLTKLPSKSQVRVKNVAILTVNLSESSLLYERRQETNREPKSHFSKLSPQLAILPDRPITNVRIK